MSWMRVVFGTFLLVVLGTASGCSVLQKEYYYEFLERPSGTSRHIVFGPVGARVEIPDSDAVLEVVPLGNIDTHLISMGPAFVPVIPLFLFGHDEPDYSRLPLVLHMWVHSNTQRPRVRWEKAQVSWAASDGRTHTIVPEPIHEGPTAYASGSGRLMSSIGRAEVDWSRGPPDTIRIRLEELELRAGVLTSAAYSLVPTSKWTYWPLGL